MCGEGVAEMLGGESGRHSSLCWKGSWSRRCSSEPKEGSSCPLFVFRLQQLKNVSRQGKKADHLDVKLDSLGQPCLLCTVAVFF